MEFWQDRPQWLDNLAIDSEKKEQILELRKEHKNRLLGKNWASYREAVENRPKIKTQHMDVGSEAVSIGRSGELSQAEDDSLLRSLKAFCPWKKGPYNIFGHHIDSEWQSQHKWERIVPFLGSLKGQTIADIGCNNGYFMYRMLDLEPQQIIGFEPVVKHWYNFQLLNFYADSSKIAFELFGAEHLDLFPQSFDTIFCLGILYHHTDPISLIRKMALALRKKGRIIIDCQGIAGDQPIALVPRGRYAGAKGIWYLPTLSCLHHWVERCGLKAETIFAAPLSPDEQRASSWADIKSLSDFLSDDKKSTIEGYPAPHRFYIIAKK